MKKLNKKLHIPLLVTLLAFHIGFVKDISAEDTRDFVIKNGKDGSQKSDETAKGPKISAGMPRMNFSTFIVSLNHSALVHLGVMEDPTTGTNSKNMELAKQTIEVLAMLEIKTKGNLSDEEARMLKSLLYDLRMMYVKAKNT